MELLGKINIARYFTRGSAITIVTPIETNLREIVGNEALRFIDKYVDPNSSETTVLETSSRFNVESIVNPSLKNFVNIKKINDIRYLNKFFESVNQRIPFGGVFIGKGETYRERRNRIFKKFPAFIAYPYYLLDFVYKRVIPKWILTKGFYFALTNGKNRVLSRAEILGRLCSCGFEILEETEINNELFFAVKKVKVPSFDKKASYGPLFKMRRIGKGGHTIGVYKFRTMHPYAEYLQEYVYKKNSLAKGGKLKNDFRVTYYGKIMRKMWIDELPMLLNLIKGELKIVGVRPLSQHYLNLYHPDLKAKRLKHKPGLVPPFYVDMPHTLEEIMASEEKYLDLCEQHPIKTDFLYFFKAFHNILFKGARSK